MYSIFSKRALGSGLPVRSTAPEQMRLPPRTSVVLDLTDD